MSITEEEVMIDGAVRIGATVAYGSKEGKSPAIVIVMGTGTLDRDGNGKGFNLNIYRDLAKSFADWGFVSLRYDKRGTHKSEGDFKTAGLSDLVDDAISVVRYAKSLPFVDADKVIVCGHSEGAMVSTLLTGKEDVAGLILLGGAGTCLRDAQRYQYREIEELSKRKKGPMGFILRKTATYEKSEAKGDELYRKAETVSSDSMRYKGISMSAKWLREHNSYTSEDFRDMIEAFGRPVLAVTGTADLNVSFRQLDTLNGIPRVECYAPENVNHILREVDDDNDILKIKKQYARLSKDPIHQGTLDRMREWLRQFGGN
jgi:hypothetical protein